MCTTNVHIIWPRIGTVGGVRADLADQELHAPALLDFEFVSALRGLTLGGQLSAVRAHDALADFDALPNRR